MKKILLGMLLVVVVGIGAIVFFAMSTGRELRPVADRILHEISDGKAEEVYAEAADAFRQAITMDDFKRLVTAMHEGYGAFKEITGVTGSGASTSVGHDTEGSVSLDLSYEKGTTTGKLLFVKTGGTWRMTGFHVDPLEDRTPPPPTPPAGG
jgi:gas vesicle protein